jgi:hypothetical protein
MEEAGQLSRKEMAALVQQLQGLLSESRQPEAGSVELDKALARIQGGQVEPTDMHRADGLVPAPDLGIPAVQGHYRPVTPPRRPELSKVDYFGTVAAIGVIGLFVFSIVGIIATLVVQVGKSSESASYRATIEELVQKNQELSAAAVKAAENGKPRCYGLFVQSCGGEDQTPSQPEQQTEQPQNQLAATPVQPAKRLTTLICDANAMETQTPVNMRSGEGVQFPVVAQVPCGGAVEIIRLNDSWSEVSANEFTGFMKNTFLGR